MSELNIITPLGDLAITEVYAEYDGPRLFACTSASGALFLGIWVGEEPAADIWLFVPVSLRRLGGIRTGEFSVREAVERCEESWVWRVRTPFDDSPGFADRIPVSQLNPQELPGPKARLSLPDNHLRQLPQDVVDQARQAQRDVILLALQPQDHVCQEVASDTLGAVLINAQAMNRYLAYPTRAPKGRLPRAVLEENALVVRDLFAASFGVRLESRARVNVLGESPAAPALEKFMDLLQAADNREKLQELLPTIGVRAAVRYRGLLKALSDSETAINVQWGSPDQKRREVQLALGVVRNTLNLLKEVAEKMTERYELPGRLVGLVTDKWRFEFLADDGERYVGDLGPQLKTSSLVLPIDGLVGTAVIEETVDVSPVTGVEKSTYVLIDMVPGNDVMDHVAVSKNGE